MFMISVAVSWILHMRELGFAEETEDLENLDDLVLGPRIARSHAADEVSDALVPEHSQDGDRQSTCTLHESIALVNSTVMPEPDDISSAMTASATLPPTVDAATAPSPSIDKVSLYPPCGDTWDCVELKPLVVLSQIPAAGDHTDAVDLIVSPPLPESPVSTLNSTPTDHNDGSTIDTPAKHSINEVRHDTCFPFWFRFPDRWPGSES